MQLGVKVSGQYYWEILLSRQMSRVVRHVLDNDLVFERDSVSAAAAAAVQNPVLNSSRAVAPNSTQLITRWQRAYEL